MRLVILGMLVALNEKRQKLYTTAGVWDRVKSYGPVSLYRNISYRLYWQNKATSPVVGSEASVRLTKVGNVWLS